MAQVINTNYFSLVAQNNLNHSQNRLGNAIQRLSSGIRINSAKDDAAGQAIANRFHANIRGLTQAARNANDGISIAQTTEGALSEINNNLQRIRELTVQAKNGANSAADLNSIQQEVSQRMAEINRISDQTEFNGVKVLNGDNTLSLQVGAQDKQQIDFHLKKTDTKILGIHTLDLTTKTPPILGSKATSYIVHAKKDATATVATDNAVLIDKSNIKQKLATIGQGEIFDDIYYGIDANTGKEDKNQFVITAINVKGERGYYLGKPTTDSALNAAQDTLLASPKVNVAFTTNSLAKFDPNDIPLSTLDNAIAHIDSLRSEVGAMQNRLSSTINNLNNTVNNVSAANSRIEDADYAVEVSNMSKGKILRKAGTAVLAQANQVPKRVLFLLRK